MRKVKFPPFRRLRRRGRDGQILPLGMVFLVACVASMLFMFSSGKVVDEKLTVTHAADAAAYSAGLMQARALNYEAYVNRAIVANELAVGQALSLMSWIDYFHMSYLNVGTLDAQAGSWIFNPGDYLDLLKLLVVLNGTLVGDVYSGGSIEDVVDYIRYIVGVTISLHSAATIDLRLSQQATDLAMAAGTSQRDIALRVARKTDPTLDVDVIPTSLPGIFDFTKTYGRGNSGGDARGRLSSVVMRSRDQFTADRGWTLNGPTIWPLQKDVALKKRGGTDLVNFDEWVAIDTMAMHGKRFGCGKIGLSWCNDTETSIGWGGATVTASGSSGALGYHGNAPSENPQTTSTAQSMMVDANDYAGYWPGLSDTQDLANLDPAAENRVGISFFVSKPINTSKTVGRNPNIRPTGELDKFNAAAPGNRIAAISRAEVFFARPEARADGRTELASLYNPYWQSRLVAATATDRAYAATRQGNLILP